MTSYETFFDNDLKKMPHPRLVLKYIRETQIIKLMEPPPDGETPQEDQDASQEEALNAPRVD